MSSLGELAIKLGLDSVEFQQGITKAEHKAKQFSARTIQYLDNIDSAAKNINKSMRFEFRLQNLDRFRNSFNYVIKVSDEYTQLANKLRLVTESEAQHARAMSDVYNISLKTAQSSQATSSVYQTFAQNAKELGLAQSDVAKLTETVSKAVAISGASSATASSALVQFSQSLLMGKMKAQEFNSLMTQTPSVVQAIAKGLGVTTSELKAMVDSGDLTAQKMVEGLKKAESSVNDLYGKTSTTVSGAMQNISTATEKWVGELDQSVGLSKSVSYILGLVANDIETVGKAVSSATLIWAGYHSLNKAQEFIKARAAIYDEKQAILAANKAKQEAIAVRLQENIVLAQQTSATLANTLETYNQNKAAVESIAIQQQKIATEREQIAVEIQGTASRTERIALSNQLKALDLQEIQLSEQKTLAEKQLIATKQALKVAYAENAVAQSQAMARTVTAATNIGMFSRMTAAATAEIRLMTAAALANPVMTLAVVAGIATTALWGFSESQKQAREEALNYAESLDQVRAKLDEMTKAQLAAEQVRNARSISEWKEKIEDLKKEIIDFKRVASGVGPEFRASFMTGVPLAADKNRIIKAKEDIILKTAELENATRKYNEQLQLQKDLNAQVPIAELRDRFAELFPNVEQSQIKVDGLNVSIGDFTFKMPSATDQALEFSGALSSIQKMAIGAVIALSNFNKVSSGISPEAQKIIDRNKKQSEIYQLEKQKNFTEASKKKAELYVDPKFQGADREALIQSYTEQFYAQYQNRKGGVGKPKTPKSPKEKKTKSTDDLRKDWLSYYDEIQRANADSVQSIALNEQRSMAELTKHLKTGVVKQQEAEIARTQIAQRYAKERAELVGRYVEKEQIQFSLDKSVKELEQLKQRGLVGDDDAKEAEMRLRLKYSQDMSQSAVSAQD